MTDDRANQSNVNNNNKDSNHLEGQDIQPEEGYVVDETDAELRQSSPLNPRTSDKSMESPEEA